MYVNWYKNVAGYIYSTFHEENCYEYFVLAILSCNIRAEGA
jgi:hypothetical protein